MPKLVFQTECPRLFGEDSSVVVGKSVKFNGETVGKITKVYPMPKEPDRVVVQCYIKGEYIEELRTRLAGQIVDLESLGLAELAVKKYYRHKFNIKRENESKS